jgi:hypothetical protein
MIHPSKFGFNHPHDGHLYYQRLIIDGHKWTSLLSGDISHWSDSSDMPRNPSGTRHRWWLFDDCRVQIPSESKVLPEMMSPRNG